MWPILILAGIIFISAVLYAILHPIIAMKQFRSRLEGFLQEQDLPYTLSSSEDPKNIFDFRLTINQQAYLLKIISIPRFAEIIVNAKTTWELRYGAGNTPGKAHPIKKYLPNMKPFMELTCEEKKVVVFFPKAMKKVKYINECEMVFITPTTNVYGVTVLNEDELDYFVIQNPKKLTEQ